jgi:hypothetical protein
VLAQGLGVPQLGAAALGAQVLQGARRLVAAGQPQSGLGVLPGQQGLVRRVVLEVEQPGEFVHGRSERRVRGRVGDQLSVEVQFPAVVEFGPVAVAGQQPAPGLAEYGVAGCGEVRGGHRRAPVGEVGTGTEAGAGRAAVSEQNRPSW